MKIMKKSSIISFFILIVLLIGCQSHPDFEAFRAEILDLHKSFIEAHLNKNVDFMVRDISDDYFAVSRGEINKPSPEKMKSDLSGYINNTVFSEYRDLEEPIIGFSKDGSLAWAVFKVKVAGRLSTEDGSERKVDFICAWIALYERQDDKWILLGDVSTFK